MKKQKNMQVLSPHWGREPPELQDRSGGDPGVGREGLMEGRQVRDKAGLELGVAQKEMEVTWGESTATADPRAQSQGRDAVTVGRWEGNSGPGARVSIQGRNQCHGERLGRVRGKPNTG